MAVKKINLYVLLFCCALPLGLTAEEKAPLWQMEADKSTLHFTATVNGGASGGDFTDFSTVIYFDPDNLAQSSVEVDINLKSISATYRDVETSLMEKDWFDVAAFPAARFVSHAISKTGPQAYRAAGKLSLKGQERDVSLDFTFEELSGKSAKMKGVATLKRLDFKVGVGAWKDISVVKDEVRLDIDLKAKRP